MFITVYEGIIRHELPFTEGETVLTVMQNGGIESITASCGGKGACKKCSVYIKSDDFTGEALSCVTEAKEGMSVEIEPETRFSFADTADGEIYEPDPGQRGYGLAIDVGTTKVTCQLVSLETGQRLAKLSGSNTQRIFGGDVLFRLMAADGGHAQELHGQIIKQTEYYIKEICREAEIQQEDIKIISVTGNTIMMHFFAGLDPAEKSVSPFEPVSLFGETVCGSDIGLDYKGKVYLAPAASGYIGSDVLCGLLTCGLGSAEKIRLMVDLGTNTEMAMGNRDRIVACSADGGAVFKASLLENGMTASVGAVSGVRYTDGELVLTVLGAVKPKGICGSGFIDILGIMYEEEILDELGHIADPDEVDSPLAKHIGEKDGHRVFFLTEEEDILISQADISKFQLAKAAVAAGIRILAQEENISLSDIDRLILGGGFGSFAHRKNAALLGIIPQECVDRSEKLGNTALAGAISAALSEKARNELSRLQKIVSAVDLSTHSSFSTEFMDAMTFE